MRRLRLGFGIVAAPIIGCAQPSGDGLNVVVSPLQLPGIGAACYDLAVYAGQGATRQTVWTHGDPTRTALGHDQALPPSPTNATPGPQDTDAICSTVYGNRGGGDISYIGTCDASNDSNLALPGVQNDVTIWFDGLYTVDGNKPQAEVGEWRDPCPDGCTLSVDCNENEDSLVRFDFTVMREAQQGFFDIAVNFEDVFCSAKVDCQYADGRPIEALFDANGDRQQTAIAAIACTAGPGQDAGTVLHMNGVRVECGETGGGGDGLTFALPMTCIEGEGAFGMYAVDVEGSPSVSPILWDAQGDYTFLPTRPGDLGGVVSRRMDDSHVIGFVFGPQSDGFSTDGYLAVWTKSGASWVLTDVADDPAVVDFFEGFDCVGTLAAGRCVSNGEDDSITSWELSGGAIGPTTTLPIVSGYDTCSSFSFAGYAATSAFARCDVLFGSGGPPFAYDLTTGTYTALSLPTGTAALPTPQSQYLMALEAQGPNTAVGLVQFLGDGIVDPNPSRLVSWTDGGSGYTVSELSDTDYNSLDVHDGAVFASTVSSDELFIFEGAWRRFTAFEVGSTPVTVRLYDFAADRGTNGMVFGTYRVGAAPARPFYALVPASGNTLAVVPLPLPGGIDPTVEANFEGDVSNTTGTRMLFGFHKPVGSGWESRMVAWGFDDEGVTTWEELPFGTRPGDVAGVYPNWMNYTTVQDPNTLPSCAAFFGGNPVDGSIVPSLWSWPPSQPGDVAIVTELEQPPLPPASGEGVVVDLDPTVEGNGYDPVRTGEVVWQYAIYRGDEDLTCDGQPCNKVYWNTAIGFDPTVPDCRLVMQATAAAAPGLVDGVTPGGVYPVITFDVPLTVASVDGAKVVCDQDPLDGDGSGVTTGYTTFGEPLQFCFQFDGTIASSLEDCTWTSSDGGGGGGGGGGGPQLDCNDDGDCDDSDPCTFDTCKQNRCAYNPVPNCTPN